jgi:WD40 repeat protein
MAFGLERGVAGLWNLDDGERNPIELRHGSAVTNVSYATQDEYIVTTTRDDVLRIWGSETGELLAAVHLDAEICSIHLGEKELCLALSSGDIYWFELAPMNQLN